MFRSNRYIRLREAMIKHARVGDLLQEALEEECKREEGEESRDPQEVDREVLISIGYLKLKVLVAYN